ncbi:VTC domain-containing protein [Gilbertella persicaria]|uniref:VTC domain-containing protein n=1 Tax=Gilbertella persicaria TaxID=101096 RepID=UPI00221FC2E7|nr:VTC domain-containing protein [Gilbertella persicaria]KAI8084337.1 VTC domain-containing protein [Gilbertella persicaria]
MDYIQLEDQIINECFVERLQYEWNKVYEFYLIKKSEIQKRIDYCHQHLTMNNGSYSSLESILFDIHHLYHFNRLNYCGFIHLFMLHDQHSGPPIHDTLKRHSYFQRNYFWEEANNALYMLAFEMNRICLFHQSSTLNAYLDHIIQYQSMTKESDNRQPSIDKYWMHPDHVLEFVLLLSSKMTLVEDHSFYPVAKTQVGKVPKRQAFTGTLSTVYLDTPEFNDYHTLLDYINTQLSTAAMSQIISCMENSTHTILEQKVFGNPNQEWIEQRAWIKSKHIQPWLRTQYSLDSLLEKASCQYQKDGHFITNESQKHKIKQAYLHLELESRSKKPVLYVTQRRIVYTSQDCSMFVTIDTDINMMHSQGKEDLLYYKSPLSPDQTIQFPYCVIQVHNQRQSNWLSDVLMQCTGSHMLYPVPGFEVFLHGISVLYPEQVKQKPGWFFDPPPQLYHPNECGKILLGRPSLNVPNINSPRSSHSSNSSSNSSSGSSTKCHDQTFSTISTVVTCFDDDDEKQQEMNTPSASSTSKTELYAIL